MIARCAYSVQHDVRPEDLDVLPRSRSIQLGGADMPRELIDTGRDKRFVRRDTTGQFDDVVEVGKSLAQDRKRKAKRVVKAGEGDRGDQNPRARKSAAGARKTTAKKRSTTTA